MSVAAPRALSARAACRARASAPARRARTAAPRRAAPVAAAGNDEREGSGAAIPGGDAGKRRSQRNSSLLRGAGLLGGGFIGAGALGGALQALESIPLAANLVET